MQSTISKWGNSLALRLPSHVAKEAGLVEGASVTVEYEEGTIRVTPVRKRFNLSDLISGHVAGAATRIEETEWGPPEGEEVW